MKITSTKHGLAPLTALRGFTIVELLVVIVVIAILATITIVSYTGISQRATTASLQSDLTNAVTQLKLDQVTNSSFPTTLALANGGKGIPSSSGTTYAYAVSNTTIPQTFCITATKNNINYNITQDGNSQPGICPILNLDAGNTSSYPGTGTTWTDLSGNGNSGTLYGGVTYSAANGGVLGFDGISGRANVQNSLSSAPNTFEVWIKVPTTVPSGTRVGNVIGNFPSSHSVNFEYNTSGRPRLYWNAGEIDWSISTVDIRTNIWTYAVFVRDTAQNKISYYQNAVLIAEHSGSGTDISSLQNWVVGDDSTTTRIPLNGAISAVRLYDKALSGNDILQNFNTLRSRYGI